MRERLTRRYGAGGDSQALLYTLLTGDGTRVTRPLRWLAGVLRHPLRLLRGLWLSGWSKRTVILLVMQSVDTAMPRPETSPRPGSPMRRTAASAPGSTMVFSMT